jgi:hypothetical protein
MAALWIRRRLRRIYTISNDCAFCNHRTLLEANSKEKSDNTVVDIPYIKDVFKLLVIGGYVKYWKAWDELTQWFLEHHTNDESIRTWIQTEFQGETSGKNGFSRINKYVFGSI